MWSLIVSFGSDEFSKLIRTSLGWLFNERAYFQRSDCILQVMAAQSTSKRTYFQVTKECKKEVSERSKKREDSRVLSLGHGTIDLLTPSGHQLGFHWSWLMWSLIVWKRLLYILLFHSERGAKKKKQQKSIFSFLLAPLMHFFSKCYCLFYASQVVRGLLKTWFEKSTLRKCYFY